MNEKQCEYQYGEFDRILAIPHKWCDANGRCEQQAVEQFEEEWLCLGHLHIRKEESADLKEFIEH